jgi:MraZ protein
LAFRGHFEHSLDSKDRLTVPARFRAPLADGVVLSAGIGDPCVYVFPPDGFQRYTDNFLRDANPLGAEGRKLRRHFFGLSFDDTLDSAGRVRIPRRLIDHAELSGGCVVVGNDDWFEIWDAAKWAEYEANLAASVAEAAENLANPSN